MLEALAALIMVATPAAVPAATSTVPADDKIVCKRVQDIQWRTATHKVCFTVAKWRALAQETQKEKADYGRSGSFGTLN